MELITFDRKNQETSKRRNTVLHDCKSRHQHEYVFMDLLINHDLKDEKTAGLLIAWVEQNNYLFRYFNYMDLQGMAILELYQAQNIILQHERGIKVDQRSYLNAKNLGELATEFCIRYLGYTLVGCSGAKTIITASDNVEEECSDYIKRGYSIFKMRKIKYVDVPLDLFGYFEEFPSLPMKHNYYNNDEYIEYVNNGEHKFEKVLKK